MKTVKIVPFLVGASFGVLSYAIPGVPTILKNTNKNVAQKFDLKKVIKNKLRYYLPKALMSVGLMKMVAQLCIGQHCLGMKK